MARIQRLAVIGLGLIGGSLTKRTRKNGFVATTVGYTRNPNNAKLGVELGVTDEAAETMESAVRDADVVVLAVPVL